MSGSGYSRASLLVYLKPRVSVTPSAQRAISGDHDQRVSRFYPLQILRNEIAAEVGIFINQLRTRYRLTC